MRRQAAMPTGLTHMLRLPFAKWKVSVDAMGGPAFNDGQN